MDDAARREFSAFVAARGPALQRTAALLAGDWSRGEDLLQTVLVQALGRWSRLATDSAEGYLRAALVRSAVSQGRRRWRGELPTDRLPDSAADGWSQVDARDAMFAALRRLPPRQRAVVVLRFYEDLSEAATAELLGVTVGTVKSQTSKALAHLRADRTIQTETRTTP